MLPTLPLSLASRLLVLSSSCAPPLMMCAPPLPDDGFASLVPGLPHTTLQALPATPTPIQRAACARVLSGESVLLHAETGSGKSLAFLLPTLARLGLAGATDLDAAAPPRRLLIVVPTRELAVQLANEAALVVPAAGAVQIIAVGAKPDMLAIERSRVLLCTPGEMLSLLEAEGESDDPRLPVTSTLRQVGALVLDELDMLLPVSSTYGFRADKKKQAENKKQLVSPAEVPTAARRTPDQPAVGSARLPISPSTAHPPRTHRAPPRRRSCAPSST